MNACETHSKRQEIIDAILAGESSRSIASWLKPPVSHATIGRWKLKVLKTVTHGMKASSPQTAEIKAFLQDKGVIETKSDSPSLPGNAYQDSLRQAIHGRIDARLARRERWIGEAEARPVIDNETGRVIGNMMDHKALAAHDRNEGSDLEFLGRLNGLMQDTASTNVQLNIGIALDSRVSEQTEVIDIGETR